MLLLFLFSPVSFDADYDVSDKTNLLNDTIDYSVYDVPISLPKIEYPATTDKHRKYLKDLKLLYDDLMNNYEKNLSPVFSNTANPLGLTIPPMLVNIIVSGVTILGLDDTGQILHMDMMIILEWPDERLSWNNSQYSDIQSMNIRREEIWMPDISAYNCQTIKDYSPKSMQSVTVNHLGTAKYVWELNMKCLCTLQLVDYPFDRQSCDVQFFVYQHTSDKMILGAETSESDGWLVDSDAWSVLKITNRSFLFSPPESQRSSGAALFQLKLERSYGFFITFIIFPTTLLSAICILAMFHEKIDRYNRLEKIGIGIASLAAVTLILNIIAEEVPRKKTSSVISKFILANLCTLTIATLVVIINPIDIITSRLSKSRQKSNKIGPVFLATDSLPSTKLKPRTKRALRSIQSCVLNDKVLLVLFEAVIFTFFGLVASFWSTE